MSSPDDTTSPIRSRPNRLARWLAAPSRFTYSMTVGYPRSPVGYLWLALVTLCPTLVLVVAGWISDAMLRQGRGRQ